jgi:hypothetical protein
MRSMSGRTDRDASGLISAIFPFPALDVLQQASSSVFSHLFAYQPAGPVNVLIRAEVEQVIGEYVTGDFFQGLSVLPAAGRTITADDDRIGASAVAVISMGYSERRFGGAASAVGESMLIDNVPFTVIGVTLPSFLASIQVPTPMCICRCAPRCCSIHPPRARSSLQTSIGSR